MMKLLSTTCLIIALVATAFAQQLSKTEIPREDFQKIVAEYHSASPESFVHTWMRTLPAPATANASLHPEIIKNLPAPIAKLRVNDNELEEEIAQVLGPVLSQYNRGRSYQIIIIQYPTPAIIFDSVATLVISTGMLFHAESDDALLGAVAHEIAHELYAKRLRDLRQKYQLLSRDPDNGGLLHATLVSLAEVELQCDAFAAVTLSVIGRNPKEFAKLLLDLSSDFHEDIATDHPSAEIRAKLISAIVPQAALAVEPQRTKHLVITKMLAARVISTSAARRN